MKTHVLLVDDIEQFRVGRVGEVRIQGIELAGWAQDKSIQDEHRRLKAAVTKTCTDSQIDPETHSAVLKLESLVSGNRSDAECRSHGRTESAASTAPRKALRLRVVSALKWAFADFDNVTVDADTRTLSPDDFAKVSDLLKLRPMQFCIFLKALVGLRKCRG